MTIQETLEKAFEGGYDKNIPLFGNEPRADIWLNPLFWQSLGKALGWGDICQMCHENVTQCCISKRNDWLEQWHHFINHLGEGKSIESFFEQF